MDLFISILEVVNKYLITIFIMYLRSYIILLSFGVVARFLLSIFMLSIILFSAPLTIANKRSRTNDTQT